MDLIGATLVSKEGEPAAVGGAAIASLHKILAYQLTQLIPPLFPTLLYYCPFNSISALFRDQEDRGGPRGP